VADGAVQHGVQCTSRNARRSLDDSAGEFYDFGDAFYPSRRHDRPGGAATRR
jgi:hypothetical protein